VNSSTINTLVAVAAPVIFWLIVVASRAFRYPGILAAVVAWTVAWFGAIALLEATPERVARIVLAVAMGLVLGWPGRLSLLHLRRAEAEADRLFRRVSAWLRTPQANADEAVALAASLAPGAFPVDGGEWAVAAALFRRSLLRRITVDPSTLTPAAAYERAARSFWRAGFDRGLLGRRSQPDAWDEGVVLRAYYEEYRRLIPRQALVERPMIPLGGWDDAAERVVMSLADIPLADPVARRTRDAMAVLMTDELAFARGDRSEEALARLDASAASVTEAWAAMAIREGQAVAERGAGPRVSRG